jgi:cbb3-type cytochrome oxidase subunit 3
LLAVFFFFLLAVGFWRVEQAKRQKRNREFVPSICFDDEQNALFKLSMVDPFLYLCSLKGTGCRKGKAARVTWPRRGAP